MGRFSYLDSFKAAAVALDATLLKKKGLQAEAGYWLNTAVLRLQKPGWANDPAAKPQTGAALFFSVWVDDQGARQDRLCYNIHALKLRQLRGYSLTSREFATAFRSRFRAFEHAWPNVSVAWGPLTLMQGWEVIQADALAPQVAALARKFIEIDFLIDELLQERKKAKAT